MDSKTRRGENDSRFYAFSGEKGNTMKEESIFLLPTQKTTVSILLKRFVFSLAFIVLFLVLLLSLCCSGVQQKHLIDIYAQNDVTIRSIGDAWQQAVPGAGTSIDVEMQVPIESVPSPLHALLFHSGLALGYDIRIHSASGEVRIESALSGVQQGDVVKGLESLFTPGNPFWVEETIIDGEFVLP